MEVGNREGGDTLTSILSQDGRGGKRGEDGFPPLREQGKETPFRPAAVGSCFRRNDEVGCRNDEVGCRNGEGVGMTK